MDLLLFKLLVTPLFVAGLTLAGRRWGPAVSGALAGLPLTSGPVSVFLALEQGKTFATQSAIGMVAGLIAVAAFSFTYALAAPRTNWIVSLIFGSVAFFGATTLLSFSHGSLLPTFLAVIGFLIFSFLLIPRSAPTPLITRATSAFQRWDLPLRMSLATALVLLLTAVAPRLGAHWTGLLSPFPVFGSVLTVFAHRASGPSDAQRVLRGVVLGSFAFAVFFLIVGLMLVPFGCAKTYSLATFCALAINAFLFALLRRKMQWPARVD
jgi:hypothetical protein